MRIGLLGLALLLGAAAPARAEPDNPAHDRLVGMTPAEQRGALRDFLGPERGRCPAVTGAYFAGLDRAGQAFWDVRCRAGLAWRLRLAPDGTAPAVLACPEDTELCFTPVPRSSQPREEIALARCTAACVLQDAPGRPACISRCLQGTESIAAAPGAGPDRHLAIVVSEAPGLVQGFVAGGENALAAAAGARRACEAVARPATCRVVVTAVNRCVAAAQWQDGRVHVGIGTELDDAEARASQACGGRGACEIVTSGC